MRRSEGRFVPSANGVHGRRAALRGGLVLAGAGAFAAACGGGKEKEPEPAGGGVQQLGRGTSVAGQGDGPPKPGGQLREATITQAPHFSPYHPGADPSFVNTWRRVYGYYEPLWGFKDISSGERLDLRLAASYEQPDPATVIVKLRDTVFHHRPPANGRTLTAEDVAARIEFVKKPPASGGAFIQGGKDLKAVSVVDEKTVKFEMFGPRAFFFEQGGGAGYFSPKEMLDEKTLKETPPIGTGPYQYKTHTQGSTEEMTRFESFRVKEQPYISERKLTFVPDEAAMEAAFRSGQIDVLSSEGIQNIRQRDQLAKDLAGKVVVATRPTPSGMAIVMNINRDPWKDIRVREAIYRAVDVDRILNVVYFGDGERTWYFSKASYTRDPLGPDPVKQYIGYDPKKSQELLRASGIDLTKEYELMVPVENKSWVDSGRLIGEDLEKVGLKVRVNPVVRNIYLQRGGPKPGDFDLQMSVLLDYIYAKTKSGTFWDSTSLQDPEVDAIIERIEETVDVQARAKLSQEFETMLARKYSNFLPLSSGNVHFAWYNYLKGVDADFAPISGYQAKRWIDK